MSNGIERTDMNLSGVMVFMPRLRQMRYRREPEGSFVRVDHSAWRPRHRSRVEEMKAKGAECRLSRRTIRPGVRIDFVRGRGPGQQMS